MNLNFSFLFQSQSDTKPGVITIHQLKTFVSEYEHQKVAAAENAEAAAKVGASRRVSRKQSTLVSSHDSTKAAPPQQQPSSSLRRRRNGSESSINLLEHQQLPLTHKKIKERQVPVAPPPRKKPEEGRLAMHKKSLSSAAVADSRTMPRSLSPAGGPIDFAPDAVAFQTASRAGSASMCAFQDVITPPRPRQQSEANKPSSTNTQTLKLKSGVSPNNAGSSNALVITPEAKRNRRRSQSLDSPSQYGGYGSSDMTSSTLFSSSSAQLTPQSSSSSPNYTAMHHGMPLTFQNISTTSLSRFIEKLSAVDIPNPAVAAADSPNNNGLMSTGVDNNEVLLPFLSEVKPLNVKASSGNALQPSSSSNMLLLPDPLQDGCLSLSQTRRRLSASGNARGPTLPNAAAELSSPASPTPPPRRHQQKNKGDGEESGLTSLFFKRSLESAVGSLDDSGLSCGAREDADSGSRMGGPKSSHTHRLPFQHCPSNNNAASTQPEEESRLRPASKSGKAPEISLLSGFSSSHAFKSAGPSGACLFSSSLPSSSSPSPTSEYIPLDKRSFSDRATAPTSTTPSLSSHAGRYSYMSLTSHSGSSMVSGDSSQQRQSTSTFNARAHGHLRSRSSIDFDSTWVERRRTLLGVSDDASTITSYDDSLKTVTLNNNNRPSDSDSYRSNINSSYYYNNSRNNSNSQLFNKNVLPFAPPPQIPPLHPQHRMHLPQSHLVHSASSIQFQTPVYAQQAMPPQQLQFPTHHRQTFQAPSEYPRRAASTPFVNGHATSQSAPSIYSSSVTTTAISTESVVEAVAAVIAQEEDSKVVVSPPTPTSTSPAAPVSATAPALVAAPAASDSGTIQKRIRTKYNGIRELISTEENFAKDLSIVLSIYVKYSNVHPYCEYLDSRDLVTLFGHVSAVLAASQSLVKRLRSMVPKYISDECSLLPTSPVPLQDIPSNVGDIFLDYMATMERPFKDYCVRNKHQMDTFYRVKKLASPTVEKWLLECNEQCKPLTSAWSLDSLLIKPVQRLLKYPLLISLLLENTSESHPDHASLAMALKKVQGLAKDINNEAADHNQATSTVSTSTSTAALTSVPSSNSPPLMAVRSSASNTSLDSLPSPASATFSAHSPTSSSSTATTPASSINTKSAGAPPSPSSAEYNGMMELLKDNVDSDEELKHFLQQFSESQALVRDFMDAVSDHVRLIQSHFDVTNSLAHIWLNWGSLMDEDELSRKFGLGNYSPALDSGGMDRESIMKRAILSLKKYRRYAMFCSPFTTASSAHVSSNKLKARVDADVLAPLLQVIGLFKNVNNVIEERARLHPQFQKYLVQRDIFDNSLATNTSSSLSSSSSAATSYATMPDSGPEAHMRRNADRFVRLHTRLKSELPTLVELSRTMSETCLIKFLAVQRDWFRSAVDSMSSVFQLRLEDIRTSGKVDPIVASFLRDTEANLPKQVVDQELTITRKRPMTLAPIRSLKESSSYSSLSSAAEDCRSNSLTSIDEGGFEDPLYDVGVKAKSLYSQEVGSLDSSKSMYLKVPAASSTSSLRMPKREKSSSSLRVSGRPEDFDGFGDNSFTESEGLFKFESDESLHRLAPVPLHKTTSNIARNTSSFGYVGQTHYIPKKVRSSSHLSSATAPASAPTAPLALPMSRNSSQPGSSLGASQSTSSLALSSTRSRQYSSSASSMLPPASASSVHLHHYNHGQRMHSHQMQLQQRQAAAAAAAAAEAEQGQSKRERHVRRKSSLGALSSLLPHKLRNSSSYGH